MSLIITNSELKDISTQPRQDAKIPAKHRLNNVIEPNDSAEDDFELEGGKFRFSVTSGQTRPGNDLG